MSKYFTTLLKYIILYNPRFKVFNFWKTIFKDFKARNVAKNSMLKQKICKKS